MTRIAVYSDLHLEFIPWTPPRTDADFCVLAGDIYTRCRCLPAVMADAGAVFGCPVVMVAGNHEHYGGKIDRTLDKMRPVAETKGIHLLENEQIVLSGCRVLGCTLWTDFRLFAGDDDARMRMDAAFCADRMTDFRVIRVAQDMYRKFRPKDAGGIFAGSVAWLAERLAVPFDGPTVVVTHHAPSSRSIPARYAEDRLSAAFASDLEHVIEEFAPSLWVHGHVHDNCDYMIGRTKVLCNPRGYGPDDLNPSFREDLVVEV